MHNNSLKIYAIMTCTELKERILSDGRPSGFADYGSRCIPGWYTDLETCKKAVEENWSDLWETCYDYACIEMCEEGLAKPGILVGWYKYDRKSNRYLPIATPKFDIHTCGRTIG